MAVQSSHHPPLTHFAHNTCKQRKGGLIISLRGKTLFLCILLILYTPTFANSSFEQVVQQVIKGFQQRDSQKINALLHANTGIYIMYRRGVPDTYTHIDFFDFDAPVPEYLPYESLPENIIKKITRYGTTPQFECGKERWNMTGLFASRTGKIHLLSQSAIMLKQHTLLDIPDKEIATIKWLESISRQVVLATEEGHELVFHLSRIQGKWYLTQLDRLSSDCSA